MSGACVCKGGEERCVQRFGGGNLSVRPGRRWKDDIKIYAGVIGLENVDWIDLARDMGGWRAVLVYLVTT